MSELLPIVWVGLIIGGGACIISGELIHVGLIAWVFAAGIWYFTGGNL